MKNATTTLSALCLIASSALTGCTLQVTDDADDDLTEETDDTAPADPPVDEPTAYEPPGIVTISVVDALIRPWDASGESWDGTGKVSEEDINQLAVLLGYADPYAAVAAFVFGLANSYHAPPDPEGWLHIFTGGAWQQDLGIEILSQTQTVNPTFGQLGWSHVPLEPSLRIAVELWDGDGGWTADDPIGIVEINYDDVVEAAKLGQIYDVPVHDQGQGEILFIGISVIGED